MACGLFVAAHMQDLVPRRDRTRAPFIASAESYPLDHQGSPSAVDLTGRHLPCQRPFKMRSQEILFPGQFLTSACVGTTESSVRRCLRWDLETNSYFSVFTMVSVWCSWVLLFKRTKAFSDRGTRVIRSLFRFLIGSCCSFLQSSMLGPGLDMKENKPKSGGSKE